MTLNDAAHCRQIVRTHARTFWLASRFLPPQKRRAAFALYAFCRVADDIVDVGARSPALNVTQLLLSYRRELDAALEGRPSGPVFRELSAAGERYDVPASVLHELLDGVARDCAPIAYARWSELSRYCEGVASSVGEMCTYVFGVPGDAATRARALWHARTLGVAMQLTNILRDVGEDARNGRCYIPREDLERFGLTYDHVLRGAIGTNEQWTALMRFEIARARELYAQAMPGIAPACSRRAPLRHCLRRRLRGHTRRDRGDRLRYLQLACAAEHHGARRRVVECVANTAWRRCSNGRRRAAERQRAGDIYS